MRLYFIFLVTLVLSSNKAYLQTYQNPRLIGNGTDKIIVQIVATEAPYLADSTGTLDCSIPIQKALNDVESMGGGIVFLPSGLYRVNSRLIIGRSTVLSGWWAIPSNENPIGRGTVLMSYNDKGNSAGLPFIRLKEFGNCGITNLSIWHPEQNATDILKYPWSIQGDACTTVKNISLINSYNGIYMQSASASKIQNIYGCVLNKGIEILLSYEFSTLININFNSSYWRKASHPISNIPSDNEGLALQAYLQNNLIAAEVGAVDGHCIYGLNAEESKVCLMLRKNVSALNRLDTARLSDLYGYGGLLGKINGKISYNNWDPWYWGIPSVNIDNVGKPRDIRYDEAPIYTATKTEKNDIFNVVDFGAEGDGITDDTYAVAKALTASRRNKGGIVYFPQGSYKITKPFLVPEGVEIRGPIGSAFSRLLLPEWETTTLLCMPGKNSTTPDNEVAFITLSKNSGIRGVNIKYPEQSSNAISFPYTIRATGDSIWIKDVLISNAYNMIDLASNKCSQFILSNINGYACKNGINIGSGTSGGKMEFISIHFGFSVNNIPDGVLGSYSLLNSVPFKFGNCTDITAFNLTSFKSLNSIQFYSQNGGASKNCSFWMSEFDAADNQTPIKVMADATANFYGLWCTGGVYANANWVEAKEGFNGDLKFYGPSNIFTLYDYPLDERYINRNNTHIGMEQSLTTRRLVESTTSIANNIAQNAVDDDVDTYWEAFSGDELLVDLGDEYEIDRFSILNAGLFGFSSAYNTESVSLFYSIDKINYFPITSPLSNVTWLNAFKNFERKYLLDAPLNPTVARYIKLKVTKGTFEGGDGHVRIRTFNVFGSKIIRENYIVMRR